MIPRNVARIVATAALTAVAACGGIVADNGPLHGVVVDPPQETPMIRIVDADGQLYDIDRERGAHTALVYFGYTHCPDVCPATMATWARVKQAMGSAAAGVRFVFVSVDPERDTPQVARAYAHQFDPSFIGLSPTPAQLDSLKAAWGFAVARETTPTMKAGEYAVTHPAGTFAITRAGKIREIFGPDAKAADIAADLPRLR